MADRRIMRASTTSTALAEGALAPAEPAPPAPAAPPRPEPRSLPGRVLRRVGRVRKWKLILLAMLTTFAVLSGVVYFGPASLGGAAPLQNAVLTDVDGRFLAELRPEQNRVVVPLERIPESVQDAFVAAEDERFWSHMGVDPIAIVRAVFANARGDREGASTITQQFVKNNEVFGVGSERSLSRKIREAITAIRLDRRYSKKEILAGYLNSIYLGNGAYGVQAASKLYFRRDIDNVSLEQAALLAGITASPSRFDPRRFPQRAKQRRDYVLDRMLELELITADEHRAALSEDIRVYPPERQEAIAPGFVDWVSGLLQREFGEDVLYRGGLRVTTSIDLDIQREAEEAVAEILDRPGDPEAAIVVLDVATGGIRAMVGGRNKRLGDLNLATQARRQAGSAFKPFVLATALDQGKTLEDRYRAPGSIRLKLPKGEVWPVRNYDRRGYGSRTLEQALAYSINTVYAQLIRDVEPINVVRMGKRLGIESRLSAVHSLALGTSDVSPLDLATAYATLAREGVFKRTTGMARVVDASGRVIFKNESGEDRRGRQAVDPDVANGVVEAMKTAVARGTGRSARLDGYTTWGKTGTTENHADAWFVGGAGGTVAVVWVGYPRGRVPMLNVHGIKVVGSSFPARIWKRVMTALLDKYRPVDDEFIPKPKSSSAPRVDPTEQPTEEPVDDYEDPTPDPTPRRSCITVICVGGPP